MAIVKSTIDDDGFIFNNKLINHIYAVDFLEKIIFQLWEKITYQDVVNSNHDTFVEFPFHFFR